MTLIAHAIPPIKHTIELSYYSFTIKPLVKAATGKAKPVIEKIEPPFSMPKMFEHEVENRVM